MESNGRPRWHFLTSHGHVFLTVAEQSDLRVADIAREVGLTERAVIRILRDLESDGYVEVTKEGRRNSYRVNEALPMRHPRFASHNVGELLRALATT